MRGRFMITVLTSIAIGGPCGSAPPRMVIPADWSRLAADLVGDDTAKADQALAALQRCGPQAVSVLPHLIPHITEVRESGFERVLRVLVSLGPDARPAASALKKRLFERNTEQRGTGSLAIPLLLAEIDGPGDPEVVRHLHRVRTFIGRSKSSSALGQYLQKYLHASLPTYGEMLTSLDPRERSAAFLALSELIDADDRGTIRIALLDRRRLLQILERERSAVDPRGVLSILAWRTRTFPERTAETIEEYLTSTAARSEQFRPVRRIIGSNGVFAVDTLLGHASFPGRKRPGVYHLQIDLGEIVRAIPEVVSIGLTHHSVHVRRMVAQLARSYGTITPTVAESFRRALDDADSNVRLNAAQVILDRSLPGRGAAVDTMIRIARSGPRNERLSALRAIANYGTAARSAAGALEEMLGHADREIRFEASMAIVSVAPMIHRKALVALVTALESDETQELTLLRICRSLQTVGRPARSAAKPLAKIMAHSEPELRVMAARTIGIIDPENCGPAVDVLLKFLDVSDDSDGMLSVALTALEKIGPPARQARRSLIRRWEAIRLSEDLEEMRHETAVALLGIADDPSKELSLLNDGLPKDVWRRLLCDVIGGLDGARPAVRKALAEHTALLLADPELKKFDNGRLASVSARLGADAEPCLPALRKLAQSNYTGAEFAIKRIEKALTEK